MGGYHVNCTFLVLSQFGLFRFYNLRFSTLPPPPTLYPDVVMRFAEVWHPHWQWGR